MANISGLLKRVQHESLLLSVYTNAIFCRSRMYTYVLINRQSTAGTLKVKHKEYPIFFVSKDNNKNSQYFYWKELRELYLNRWLDYS